MQPMKYLTTWLEENASEAHYLFSTSDLRGLFPDLSDQAFRTLLSRSVQSRYLIRVCREIYLFKKVMPLDGLLLFHVAAYLRSSEFNYISLETVLSDVGIISQIPMNWFSIMSSGRSNRIRCGEWGTIEFIQTMQKPVDIMNVVDYDQRCGLWRANVKLALRDMRITRRNCDLIDWERANEFI